MRNTMDKNPPAYLNTQYLNAERKLFNILPIETARRYHLLPIAQEGNRITIAMADPGDQEARQVISQAFGDMAFIVQADSKSIDYKLASIDAGNLMKQQHTRVLLWQTTQKSQGDLAYAQQIARLFHGEVISPAQPPNGNNLHELIEEIKNTPIELLLIDPTALLILETKLIEVIPISTLYTRTPRWPIEQILVILSDEPKHDFSLKWALHIAHASQASLTILPVLASATQLDAPGSEVQPSLSQSQANNCPLSERVRSISQQIGALNIDGVLHLRQETPQQQISAEIADGNYDLVVCSAAHQNSFHRWFMTDQVSPSINWIDCPVLVAKSRLHSSFV